MNINDRIYGPCVIDEPVLCELIMSPPIQRLKKINQYGPLHLVSPQLVTTRFEHSLGVLVLLEEFSASLEEKIAGLLHDIGHTAFSHVIDKLLKDGKEQDYHEEIQHEFLLKGEIAEILQKHNFNPADFIIKQNSFSMLKDAELCADRLDYFLRDWFVYYNESRTDYLKYIKAVNNKLVFSSPREARACASDFIRIDRELWAMCPTNLAVYKLFSDGLKIALDKKIISFEELKSSGDNEIIERMKSVKEIDEIIGKIGTNFHAVIDEKYDFVTYPYPRAVDPPVFYGDKITSLSRIDPEFKKELNEHMEERKKTYKIRVVRNVERRC